MTTWRLDDVEAADGDLVAPEVVPRAVTAGTLVFADGATQVFDAAGTTTYVEHGRRTAGEWYVDGDGFFGSFWSGGGGGLLNASSKARLDASFKLSSEAGASGFGPYPLTVARPCSFRHLSPSHGRRRGPEI